VQGIDLKINDIWGLDFFMTGVVSRQSVSTKKIKTFLEGLGAIPPSRF